MTHLIIRSPGKDDRLLQPGDQVRLFKNLLELEYASLVTMAQQLKTSPEVLRIKLKLSPEVTHWPQFRFHDGQPTYFQFKSDGVSYAVPAFLFWNWHQLEFVPIGMAAWNTDQPYEEVEILFGK